jgi:hypothetical protein
MNYYNKYLKYKTKYLELINQTGGIYKFNYNEWKSINNSGQQNCGIFINEKYPDYIVKCTTNINMNNIKIANKSKLFPKIINILKRTQKKTTTTRTKIDKTEIMVDRNEEEKYYTTMQKFDGDITSIYFDLFPKTVLNSMINKGEINKEQEKSLFDLFLGKISYTMYNSHDKKIANLN